MEPGVVAIVPPGALGVSFFYHLTQKLQRLDGGAFFFGLDNSRSIGPLLSSGLQISEGKAEDAQARLVLPEGVIFADLAQAWGEGRRPEMILACPNPDQLLEVVSALVALIESIYADDPGASEWQIPAIVLSSNGIYFQRVRQIFIEKLEESTLLGRLPDLWPARMPHIVGHLLRGVTMQTGVRRGSGSGTVYHPGPPGLSVLAGGSEEVRRRCFEVLSERGGWFEVAPNTSPTRLEFEKAMVNLMGNLLGLLYAFEDDGSFRLLSLGQILVPERESDMRELMRHVFEVGLAVRVFTQEDDFEAIATRILGRSSQLGAHVPSSLQAAAIQVESGALEAKFPPTETWLIDPLIRYARSAGLTEAATYFEGLRLALIEKLEKAVARQASQASR